MSLRRDYWHESDLGRFKVSVQEPDFPKGSNSTWMLTFPENGLTFESCFQSLFNLVDSSSPLSGFRIIHIDPVGLQPGDAFVFLPIQGLSIRDFHDTSRSILSCFSDQVMIVCRHYNIESFIGVGVGLGSYVLTSFAISNPRMVQGLILISSSWKASSFPAKAYYQKDKLFGYFQGEESITNHLLTRYICSNAQETNMDLFQYLKNVIGAKNRKNLIRILDAFYLREDIVEKASKLRAPLLLITGEHAEDAKDVVECRSKLKGNQHDWVRIDEVGLLVTEEAPHEILAPISLFLQGMGHFAPSLN